MPSSPPPSGPVAPAPAPVVVGLDVGGTKVLAVAVDPTAPATVLASRRDDTPGGVEALVAVLADAVAHLGDLVARPVAAVGVGVPALVDRQGIPRYATHLPELRGVALGDALAERLGVTVAVDNDANAAALAEAHLGAGMGEAEVLLITLGTGIGGGLVRNGELVRGASGFAGEPGHMVVDRDGLACPCGRRGCWEQYASGTGLATLARRAVADGRAPVLADHLAATGALSGEVVVAAARTGDPGALAVMDELGEWVALGVANVVDVLDPSVVVLGGGLVDAGDLLLDPVRRAYPGAVAGAGIRAVPPLRPATLGPSAGAIGAALLAR